MGLREFRTAPETVPPSFYLFLYLQGRVWIRHTRDSSRVCHHRGPGCSQELGLRGSEDNYGATVGPGLRRLPTLAVGPSATSPGSNFLTHKVGVTAEPL